MHLSLMKQLDVDQALLDVDAAIGLRAERVPARKVGVIGYCYGGKLAWLAHPPVYIRQPLSAITPAALANSQKRNPECTDDPAL